jgi:hypothetical protein
MKVSALAAKKTVRRVRRVAIASSSRPKPSKREIANFWAKSSGIVNTGETDLSVREGFDD